MPSLPDISSMKLSALKKELTLYGVDSSKFCEKPEFTSALKNARETLPRPSTTYREVGPSDDEIRAAAEKAKGKSSRSSRTGPPPGSSSRQREASASAVAPVPSPAPSPAQSDGASSSFSSAGKDGRTTRDARRLAASRSPVTALQLLRERPSERLIGERSNSFLPGSPFSFALRGSLREEDSAIVRVPDGVRLTIASASVERKPMETYLLQKGSIGVSLKVSTEENPQLLPVWTFDKDRAKSYTVSDLGLQVCGPRTIRLLAFMEMGFRSSSSVDVFVFGSVSLDKNKF